MKPTVSVIIPTYNRARVLQRAIGSVLSQTYKDFEILVIDDASTDSTREVLSEKFGAEIKCGRLIYIKNEKHLERSHSRNRGAQSAEGEYIALLDDDDIMLPECLEKLVHYLDEHKDIACVFSNFLMMYENSVAETRIKDFQRYLSYSPRELCLLGILGATCGSLYRKKIHRFVGGFRQDLNRGENKEFFNRIALNAPIGYLDEITSIQSVHKGSLSAITPEEYAYNRKYLWEEVEKRSTNSCFNLRKEVRVKAYIDISWLFLPDTRASRKYLFKAIKADTLILFNPSTWPLLYRVALSPRFYRKMRSAKRKVK
jgi:glycosyltransferase involved in cell wall biosynthesis